MIVACSLFTRTSVCLPVYGCTLCENLDDAIQRQTWLQKIGGDLRARPYFFGAKLILGAIVFAYRKNRALQHCTVVQHRCTETGTSRSRASQRGLADRADRPVSP